MAAVAGALVYLGADPSAPATVVAPPRHTVHFADVDGDGRADRVSITFPSRDGSYYDGYARLVVQLAAGGVARFGWRVRFWPIFGRHNGDLWVGATQLDHVSGLELVVGKTAPNWVRYVVLTFHARLERLPAPSEKYGWTLHGSAGGLSTAVTCTPRGVAFNRLTGPTGPNRPAHEVDQRFVWKRGEWRRTFMHRFATRNPDVAKFTMWGDCPRMPRVSRSSSNSPISV